jgi:hypothetical protein
MAGIQGEEYPQARLRYVVSRAEAAINSGTFSRLLRFCTMTENHTPRLPLTSEQRKVRDAERRVAAEQAMREHEQAQKRFYENRERLKAERLTREARMANGR